MSSTGTEPVSTGTRTLGILTDPAPATAEVARHLDSTLPDRLAERFDGKTSWRVEVRDEPLPGGRIGQHDAILDHAARHREEEGWDVVICVTDLPLRDGRRAMVAQGSSESAVGVVSLPGLGATRLRRRVRELIVEIIADLLRHDGVAGPEATAMSTGEVPPPPDRDLPGPFHFVRSEERGADMWVRASRGRWRLLLGMVRDNRPWRLLLGLRGAMIGAFAFSAFWVISPTVWRLADALTLPRLALVSFASVVVMVVWLILYHGLWERSRHGGRDGREEVVLFNGSTVLSLTIGVASAFVLLVILDLGAALLVIPESVLSEELGRSAGVGDYLRMAWLAAAAAAVAGAVGTGFDSEQAVLAATYSRREQERRARLHREQAAAGDESRR